VNKVERNNLVNKELHPQADSLVKESIDSFTTDLLLQARILARHDELVLRSHVKAALEIIRKRKSRNWQQELFILLGGILFGTFIPGFLTELSQQSVRPTWIITYVLLGFIGATLVFIGFFRQYND
jgi:hypothetical protein